MGRSMIAQGTTDRPIAARRRSDLQIVEHENRGEREFVVGDLVALEYYRLNEQEFFLLNAFDGKSSYEGIKQRFEAEFAPYCIRHQEIEHYLLDFQRKSLLSFSAPNRGDNLYRISREAKTKRKLAAAKNVLAFRFRGIDPQRLFQLITPWSAWFFSAPMVLLNCGFIICTAIWFLSHFAEFSAKFPSMAQFFSQGNLLLLFFVLGAMKVFHELGHGIVFTKYGGRCHELGVMFLVLMPTLFVNTSDSWRISNRWKRAAIAAAGVYVELFIAAVGVWAVWYGRPGLIQYCFLNALLLGSVSAILFNGNPLLRFDAYYLLTDLIGIPNLQQRGQRLIRDWCLKQFFGIDTGDGHLLEAHTKRWMVSYVLASFAYRLFVVFLIAFALTYMLQPLGLGGVGKLLAGTLMLMVVLGPMISFVKYFFVPGNRARMNLSRARLWGIGLGAALCFLLLVPIPDWIKCPCVIQPKDSRTVYMNYDGKLEKLLVVPGTVVDAGDTLAVFRNIEVELEIAELQGQLQENETKQRMVRLAQFETRDEDVKAITLQSQANTIRRRLDELEKIQKSLTLTANRNGVVIAEWQTAGPESDSETLQEWSGSSLSEENLNATYRRGQPVCRIGDLHESEAQILIDQDSIDFIRVGQPVRLKLDSLSSDSFETSIESISKADSGQIRPNAASVFGGDIETEASADQLSADQTQATKPTHATFHALAPMPKFEQSLADGLKGTARVKVGSRSLASRFYRFLNTTFRLQM